VNFDYDADVRQVARALSEIAYALEATADPDDRVEHALALVQDLVPYQACALLRLVRDGEVALHVQPPTVDGATRDELGRKLGAAFRLIAADDEDPPVHDEVAHHLTLPVMGLDQVIGVIRVTPPAHLRYEAKHVRLLSVVAAQIGAYLALIKLHEEEARRSQDLRLLNDVQRTLVGIVSHDLRSPLAVITTVAATLLPRATDQRQARALERALRNAQKATRIINDLLDVTQARVNGLITTSPSLNDLRALVIEAVEDARATHPGRPIELVDEVGAAIVGQWDPDRISQLLTNLLANGLTHGDPARPLVVRLSSAGGVATLAVHNDGAHIPAELLPTLFDPFTRREQHRQRGGGLGLGLYIVALIVRAHDGEVTVDSRPERGTTFTVRMPIVAMRAVTEEPVAPVARDGERTPPLVMIIDDDDDLRSSMRDLLSIRGYATVEAANGAIALDLLRGGLRPRIILVDMQMPVMDGPAFCEACAADPELAAIPVLVVSADVTAAMRAARFGGASILRKPVKPDALLKTIERLS
jgi:signal transduction histidine kinase